MSFSSNKPYLIRGLYEWILDNQGTPHLVVNADAPGTDVPREHVSDGEIILNVAPSAIQGFEIENHLIYFSARFSGIVRHIQIPMHAVLAIVARENGLGMVFPPEQPTPVESDESFSEKVEVVEDGSDKERVNLVEKEKNEPNKALGQKKRNTKKSETTHLRVVK